MSSSPNLNGLSGESFPDVPSDMRSTWDTFLSIFNPFVKDTSIALSRGLSIGDNLQASLKTVSVTVPGIVWTPVTVFANSWTAFSDASYGAPEYYIDSGGVVHLSGMLGAPASGGYGLAAFTLPAGYRPRKNCIFAAVAGGAITELRALTSGAVQFQSGAASTYCSLHGATFLADSPASPLAPVGGGFPIKFDPALSKVSACWLVQAQDTKPDSTTSVSPGLPDWAQDSKGQVVVKSISGLTPGRSYKLTFLCLA